MGTCIYCGYEGKLSKEDYLSKGLGCFRGFEPLLDRVCKPCNRDIGKAEEQFLRAGPIALFRELVGVKDREGTRPSPFYRGSAGAPPLLMVGKAPDGDFDILWEVEPGTENVSPLRQVIVQAPDGGTAAFPIPEWMTESNHLLGILRDRKLEGCTLLRIYAKPEEREWVLRVVSCLGDLSNITWSATNWPPQRVPLQVTVQVTNKYFRAIAKIGFHYTLKQFPDLVGNEPQFKPIRDFIRWGIGDESRFVRQRMDQFVGNFLRGERPTHWMHILTVERTIDRIIFRCQFFAGPHSLPPGYEVSIGRNPACIARPTEKRAHVFVYLDEESTQGYDGKMDDLRPVQRVKPVWGVPPFFFSM